MLPLRTEAATAASVNGPLQASMDLGLKPPPPPPPNAADDVMLPLRLNGTMDPPPLPNAADDVMLPLRRNGTMKPPPPPPPNAAEKTFPLRTEAATAASVKGLQAS